MTTEVHSSMDFALSDMHAWRLLQLGARNSCITVADVSLIEISFVHKMDVATPGTKTAQMPRPPRFYRHQ